MQQLGGMGVTQLKRQPPEHVNVTGSKFVLRKNAEDAAVVFQHERVTPLHKFKVQVAKGVYAYGVLGILAPLPGSLEKAVHVVYIGFHSVEFDPLALGKQDIMNMHVYTKEAGSFPDSFVASFINPVEQRSISERTPVMPYITQMEEQDERASPTTGKQAEPVSESLE